MSLKFSCSNDVLQSDIHCTLLHLPVYLPLFFSVTGSFTNQILHSCNEAAIIIYRVHNEQIYPWRLFAALSQQIFLQFINLFKFLTSNIFSSIISVWTPLYARIPGLPIHDKFCNAIETLFSIHVHKPVALLSSPFQFSSSVRCFSLCYSSLSSRQCSLVTSCPSFSFSRHLFLLYVWSLHLYEWLLLAASSSFPAFCLHFHSPFFTIYSSELILWPCARLLVFFVIGLSYVLCQYVSFSLSHYLQ